MTRTWIKICGVTSVEAARAAIQARAHAVGLMFAEGSPRTIEVAAAKAIVDVLPNEVEPVGVFLDQSAAFITDIAAQLGLRTVQLHGNESLEQTAALSPLRVIKAISFDGNPDKHALAAWGACENVTALLVDAPPPGDERLTGGHGVTFDWSALATAIQRGAFADAPPIILAGGLTPGNVGDAIETVRPFGVDVSSGVESTRGCKDPQRITAFCQAVRQTPERA